MNKTKIKFIFFPLKIEPAFFISIHSCLAKTGRHNRALPNIVFHIFATYILNLFWLKEWSQQIKSLLVQDGARSNEDTSLLWITSMSCSSDGWNNSTKVVTENIMSPGEPLSGAGIHVEESVWTCVSQWNSLALQLSHLISPILTFLCPCFPQFLSTSLLLPYLLIIGTPQRWRIIPVRHSKSFMSWEDMLARVLPAPFPLHGYLH